MSDIEQISTITTLYISRGQGLETLFDKYGNNDKAKLIAIKYKSALSADHSLPYQIGPARVRLYKGLSISSQTWYESEIKFFRENYESLQHKAANTYGNGDVFDRGTCDKVYLLDTETNTVAEFGLVPKKDRIYTPEYKKIGIQALNPKYQVSLELTGTLYILTDKNKLKKWGVIKTTDFTKTHLEKILPNICATTRMRTCERTKWATLVDREITCRFNGDVPQDDEND